MIRAMRIVCALLLLLTACASYAQGPNEGALTLTVGHEGDTPMVAVTVELTPGDPAGPAQRIAIRPGHVAVITLLGLRPGAYAVRAFEATPPNPPATAEFSLGPGELLDVPLIIPKPPALSSSPILPPYDMRVLNVTEIQSLPSLDGQVEGLAALFPGANDATLITLPAANEEQDGASDSAEASRHGSGDAAVSPASGPSYSGLAPTQNNEAVDGLTVSQNFRSGPRGAAAGGPVSGATFAQGAVRSFRILPRTFSAQYGNAAGAVIAVTSRAGSSQLHGGAFYLLRESAFAASNPYSAVTHYQNGVVTASLVKPQDTLHQLGGHLGLSLGHRERSPQLFASLEEQLRRNPAISTPENGNFYALSATQTALLRNRGVTAAAQNTALNYLDSLSGPVDRSSNRTLAFVRLDDQLTRHDRLALSYALNRFNAPSGTGFDQSSDAVTSRGRGSLGDRSLRVDDATARWLHLFSSHFSHELRAGWSRDFESEQPRVPLAQEPAISPGGFAPQVSIAPDGFTYGTPAGLGRAAFPDERRVQFANLIELAFGHHLFSIGGDWSRIDDRIAQLANAEGSFAYDSGTTNGRAGGLVDWITDFTFNASTNPNGGCPSIVSPIHNFCFRSFTQSFGGDTTSFVTHEFAGFVEDNFRPSTGVKLTLGVRYEYTLLPLPQTPNLALDAAFTNLTSPQRGATSSFPEDRNNVGPRVSIAWAPGNARFGTVHLGYGIFFGRLTGATVRAALADTALPSTTTHIRITPTTVTACPQVPNQGFGYPCAYLGAPPAVVAQTSSATLFAYGFRFPTVQRGTLRYERGFGERLRLSAEYAAAIATQLPGSTDLNIAPATASQSFIVQGGDGYAGIYSNQTFTLPLYTARRVAQYGPVTALVSDANATYHAGTIEAQLSNFHRLELRANFTFSRSIDYAPQVSATPRLNGQLDPFTNGYDKGLSDLNFPQRFTGQLVYSTRVARVPAMFRPALNDWRIAAIAFAGSGAPYSYAIFGGTRLSGGRESINGSGGSNYLPTIGRNTLRLPPRGSVDLRLAREFTAGKLRVNAFAEAFNLFNTRNLARVETRAFLIGAPIAGAPSPLLFQDAATVAAEGLTTRPFGTPTSSTTGLSRERQAELGVRIAF